MLKRVSIIALAVLMLPMVQGCKKKNIINNPLGISVQEVSDWYEATGAVKTISEFTVAGPKVVKTLVDSGVVDQEYYVGALNLFKTIDQAGLRISAILQKTPNNFGSPAKAQVYAELQVVIAELQKFNAEGGTHIKNPNSMAAFNNLLGTFNIALEVLQSVSGGK